MHTNKHQELVKNRRFRRLRGRNEKIINSKVFSILYPVFCVLYSVLLSILRPAMQKSGHFFKKSPLHGTLCPAVRSPKDCRRGPKAIVNLWLSYRKSKIVNFKVSVRQRALFCHRGHRGHRAMLF